MTVEIAENGKKAIVISALTLFCGVLFADYLLAGLGVSGFVFLVYKFNQMKNYLKTYTDGIIFEQQVLEQSFTAGQEYTETISIENRTETNPQINVPYGALDQSILASGKQNYNYSFKPSLAANYITEKIDLNIDDSFGLIHGSTELPFRCSFKVYPRVVSAALDALSFLEGHGIQGAGEQISALKGRGYEYADSREYTPGDSFKMVNWKATARLNKLIVNEYYLESSGAIHIVYENMVTDPVSSDVLSACFLRTVQSFAERSWVIGLTIIERGEVVSHVVQLHPDRAVASALRFVLANDRHFFRQLYDVLDPVYRPRLDLVMDRVIDESRYKMNLIKDELFGSAYGGVLYITSLIDDPVNLFEIGFSARRSGTRMVVLEPCTPWIYTSLEEAYRIWNHYDKINRALARDGIGVAVSVEEAQEKMGQPLREMWA